MYKPAGELVMVVGLRRKTAVAGGGGPAAQDSWVRFDSGLVWSGSTPSGVIV